MGSFMSALQCGSSNHPAMEAGALGNGELQWLPRAGCSNVGYPPGTWLLHPFYGDLCVGRHDSFPLVNAQGGSHLRSRAVGTLFRHHPVAGKILHFASVFCFFFSSFLLF